MMVSTDLDRHFANSGTTLSWYWKAAERCIKKAADVGIKMCGTVSTIRGSPITGATKLEDAVEFSKRWLEIGAYDIEHADHDGSASADQVYRYFSMVLDEIPHLEVHLAHFHETKRIASASVLAALQAGINRFEGTLGGLGGRGQPTNFLDDCPVIRRSPGIGQQRRYCRRSIVLELSGDYNSQPSAVSKIKKSNELAIRHCFNKVSCLSFCFLLKADG